MGFVCDSVCLSTRHCSTYIVLCKHLALGSMWFVCICVSAFVICFINYHISILRIYLVFLCYLFIYLLFSYLCSTTMQRYLLSSRMRTKIDGERMREGYVQQEVYFHIA